ARRPLLHLIEWPVRDASKQRACVFIADLPARHDVEEGLDRRRAEPPALRLVVEINQRRRFVAGRRIAQTRSHSLTSKSFRGSHFVYSGPRVFLLQFRSEDKAMCVLAEGTRSSWPTDRARTHKDQWP